MNSVSVILGSESDNKIYEKVKTVFTEFHIPFEKRILSAHRAPNELREYIIEAEKNGIKIFIAIAGMAAALPGVIASYTTRPVIGVPVALNSPVMGFDAIFSMLQMPSGIPVAVVTVNGGANAAYLAIRILNLIKE